MDFRKNAKHLMCDLTTKWILESAQSLACALIYWYYVLWIGSGELLIPWSERGLRCSDGSGMLIGDPLGEGSNASSTNSELWRAEKSSFRMRAQTLGLYLSFYSSSSKASDLLPSSGERRNSDTQRGAACS